MSDKAKPAAKPEDERETLLAELEKQKAANAELEARLSAAENAPPGAASADDKAYAKSPRHRNAYTVNVIGGPRKDLPATTVENCCDESEAVRRVCVRTGIASSEHRFQVQKVKTSAA